MTINDFRGHQADFFTLTQLTAHFRALTVEDILNHIITQRPELRKKLRPQLPLAHVQVSVCAPDGKAVFYILHRGMPPPPPSPSRAASGPSAATSWTYDRLQKLHASAALTSLRASTFLQQLYLCRAWATLVRGCTKPLSPQSQAEIRLIELILQFRLSSSSVCQCRSGARLCVT